MNIRLIVKTLLKIENDVFQNKVPSNHTKERLMFLEKSMEEVIESDSKERYFYDIIFPLIDKVRQLEKKFPKFTTADKQKLRNIRKKIMNECFVKKVFNEKNLEKQVNCKCKKKLLPILDERFNVREVIKNILLLEDHLLDKRRRCSDCCKKHLLLIEAFLEEAITLSKSDARIKLYKSDIKTIKECILLFLGGNDNYYSIVKKLKQIKKKYLHESFNFIYSCI